MSIGSIALPELLERLGVLVREQWIDHDVEVSIDDLTELVHGQRDAMVCNA